MNLKVGWKTVGALLLSMILLLGVLGILAVPVHEKPGTWLRWVDLDRELNVPMAFSAFLLAASGWLVIQLVRVGRLKRGAIALGAFLIFMAIDEMVKVHETLEKVTGIDWQLIYLPIVLIAGLGWLSIWLTGDVLTRILWAGGAACWVLSQGLEAIQWGGLFTDGDKVAGYTVMMVAEELLEMTGSALFLLTLFRWRWPEGLTLRELRAESLRVLQPR